MDYTRPFAPPHRTSETLSSRLERVRILRTVQRIVKRKTSDLRSYALFLPESLVKLQDLFLNSKLYEFV